VCCDLLFEGWDCPAVSAVGVMRPTRLRYRYTQMVGRGTRPCPELGKEDLLVVDFDWKASAAMRDLCALIDLYRDEEGETPVEREGYRRAKQKAEEMELSGERVEPEKLLDDARSWATQQTRLMITLSGRKARYFTDITEIDPVGVGKLLGVQLKAKYDLRADARCGPASQSQLNYLRMLGVGKIDPDRISKWGASKLITVLKKRQSEGHATPLEVARLIDGGMNPMVARTMKSSEIAQAQVQQEMWT
jgi:hypothetical protein